MKNVNLSRYALSVCAAAILLVGCGGLQAASPPTSTHLAQTNPSRPIVRDGSAMPSTKKADFVYAGYSLGCGTFCFTASINVYTFPEGRFVGSWMGAKGSYVSSECADGAGNIFVTYSYSFKSRAWKGEILKFAHGGTSIVETLKVGNEQPQACSVDPNSGDLAVVSVGNSDTATLLIFSGGSGSPTAFRDPGVNFYGVGYDDMGNIFADGVFRHSVTFAELPKGGTSFKQITLNKPPEAVGEVQWDGRYVTLGFGIHRHAGDGLQIDRLDITGSSAQVVGVTRLKRTLYDAISQYWFAGKEILGAWHFQPRGCPVSGCGAEPGGVGDWSYPTGSMIAKHVTHGRAHLAEPGGVALSLGQPR